MKKKVHPAKTPYLEITSDPVERDATPLPTDRIGSPGRTGSTSQDTIPSRARHLGMNERYTNDYALMKWFDPRRAETSFELAQVVNKQKTKRHSHTEQAEITPNRGNASPWRNRRTNSGTKKNAHHRDRDDIAHEKNWEWPPKEQPPTGDLSTDDEDTSFGINGSTKLDTKEKAHPTKKRYDIARVPGGMRLPPIIDKRRDESGTGHRNNGSREAFSSESELYKKTVTENKLEKESCVVKTPSAFESDGAKLQMNPQKISEQTKFTTQNTLPCHSQNLDRNNGHNTGASSRQCRLPKKESVYKVVKILVYIILFACVLGSLLVSKATLLLITANMRPGITFTCSGQTPPNCVLLSHQSGTAGERTQRIANSGNTTDLPMCDSLTVRWIWAGFLVICTPHMLTVLSSLSKMLGWVCKICLEAEDDEKESKDQTEGSKQESNKDEGKSIGNKDGSDKGKKFGHVVKTIISEVAHAIGVSLLVFRVLPGMSSVLGSVIGLGASTVPAIGDFLTRKRSSRDKNWLKLKLALSVLCVVTQLSAIVLWPVLIGTRRERFFRGDLEYEGRFDFQLGFLIPISLLLISCRYWENYMPCDFRNTKTTLAFLVGIIKIATTFFMVIFLRINTDGGVQRLFNIDSSACNGTVGISQIPGMKLDWVWLWLICTGSGMLAYLASLSAARAHIQQFSYSFPVLISSPLLVISLILACQTWHNDHCAFMEAGVPGYIWFHCFPKGGTISVLMHEQIVWIAIFWLISQIWTTAHVWFPEEERLAASERLFVLPLWDAVLLEQDLLHNRRRKKPKKSDGQGSPKDTPTSSISGKKKPIVYLCATMWHETEQEMKNLINSFVKLDRAKTGKEIYEIAEVQIYFDDAFEKEKKDDQDSPRPDQVNNHVRRLYEVMEDIEGVKPRAFSSTPYGGRITWELKNGTKVVAHLKDKVRIKVKKRWSQVMYMNYIMGYCEKEKSQERDVYLLALDGDVDFEPSSVELLVDMMEKEKDLGAVCGRIKPVGSGVTYWYQVFEYAIGHWLQKATEHVFGCVLCSPGCFSMFRGSALVKGNPSVLDIYSTLPTEPEQHLQYDLGEDRWLCTLLIKHGYRVDYCAAADARTFVPESLGDFFKQRRRWAPSTMVNIKDLLWDWKTTYKRNAHVSLFYLAYQIFLFIMSMFGPGTIFLMISGALHAAFSSQGLSIVTAILLNAIPVLTFTLVCFKGSSSLQLTLARILTLAYALLQFVVLIGIVTQLVREGLCSPISFFFFFVAGTFVLAACLHPQEFGCIFTGFIYFLLIPSMYLFLVLFAMINMHDLSWGTREMEQGKKTSDGICAKFLRAFSGNRSAGYQHIPLTDVSTQTLDCETGYSREVRRDGDVLSDSESPAQKPEEREFFRALIMDDGVLKVETSNPEEAKQNEQKTEKALKSLRNKVSLYFLISNTALVLIIFTIQLQNRNTGLSIPWPCNGKSLQLEPVGILFLFSYCLIMAVQIIGMLFHCFETFLHINAFTKLGLNDFFSRCLP